ncbi:hypothetical protein RUM43_004102 [Polyplax serrata]|uniref:Uncharacterized protein n=1 Tax=Polyplax serrata TaxID=468196 RepID=A0AAN8SAJ0_POLSC
MLLRNIVRSEKVAVGKVEQVVNKLYPQFELGIHHTKTSCLPFGKDSRSNTNPNTSASISPREKSKSLLNCLSCPDHHSNRRPDKKLHHTTKK